MMWATSGPMTATVSVTPPREPGALTMRAPSGDRAGDEERLGGLGGNVAGRETGPAGREHEAGAVLHGRGDRSANGIDLVGDDHDRGVDAVIGEEACGERAGEVLGEAGGAAVRDRDDACGNHVSDERCRGGGRSGARECRR